MSKPSTYNEEIATIICDRLADGKSMRQICASATMPDRKTIRRWKAANPEFAARCLAAWEEKADTDFDKIEDIESKMLSGKIDPKVGRSVISSMQWRLEKMKPRVYARTMAEKELDDREHTITGGLPDDEPAAD